MILSFHPIFEADRNIICAGRPPDESDLKAIRKARAVILPQGCRLDLYRMARENCGHVFPDLRVKFDYPGKLGQMRFFRENRVPHPLTFGFESLNAFEQDGFPEDLAYPLVFKFDWGGEGETVFAVPSESRLVELLEMARRFEASGQRGFLLQEMIPGTNRSLRIAVVGRRLVSYWRVGDEKKAFGTSLSRGGLMDHQSDPRLQAAARDAVAALCRRSHINLAGFDLIFGPQSPAGAAARPLFLEINWFFGRRGFGGSEAYYRLLMGEIEAWIDGLNLKKMNHLRENL
jgi:ribosomal protein S6--L-glutamate ligase